MRSFISRHKLILIFMAALAVRIALIFISGTYLHPVRWEYEDIANNVLGGKGFVFDNFLGTTYRSLTTPLYVFLCAGIYALTNHSFLVVLLTQSVVSLLLAIVIYRISYRMFGETVAIISAAVTVFHPGFVYYDVYNLIPLSIDSFLIALAVLLFMKVAEKPTVGVMSLIGCVIGLGTLSRGIIGALLPFLSAYFLLFAGCRFGRKIGFVTVLALSTFLVLSPWIARNFIIHKQFVFISSTSGENLYRGNNPSAPGTSLTADGRSVRELWPETVVAQAAALDEIGQKKFFEKEALRFIIHQPGAFARLYLKKLYYFWWFSPQSGSIYPKGYTILYKIAYVPLFVFSAFGLVLALSGADKTVRDNAWLIVFVFMAVCMTQSLFYVEGRHRWLVEPLLIIFFAYGVTQTWKLTRKVLAPAAAEHTV